MQSLHPVGAAASTQRETELLLREVVQRLEQSATLNEKTKQIQEWPEEKGTLNGEIQDLKDMLEDRQETDPPRRTAQPRRRIREVEMLDRIRQFQEREEREHLRNWLEVEKQRLDTDCMDWLFLERQCFRFEHRAGLPHTID
ncbi:unnamed protein product [Arctogadus glacialis]